MAQKSGPPAIVFIIIFLILAAGGYWYFSQQQQTDVVTPSVPGAAPPPPVPRAPQPGKQTAAGSFTLPASVPSGTSVRIDGSTSMVTINQNLKRGFESQYPGTNVITVARGSETGIKALIEESADLAAVSRPLSTQEQSQGLVAVPIAADQIAVVVGANNPYRRGLSRDAVQKIFQGEITDWSEIGEPSGTIRVLNRPPVSGTYQAFQELVLDGEAFGNTPNITTLERDATTPMLQALGTNGIGYATYAQVANQQTVRVVPIEGLTPEASNYPFQRTLYYVYKNPPSQGVEAFLGYTKSSQGQEAMLSSE